jgi:hypothetical protein
MTESAEEIHFVGLLSNADWSLSNVKLRHGFKIEHRSLKDISDLFSSARQETGSECPKQFLESAERLAEGGSFIAVTNTFDSWGNEEGYFTDLDPSGPERTDGFLIPDYLEPVIRLMRLFKDGNLAMPMTIHYEVRDGRPYASTYGGGYRPGFEREKYSLTDLEVPNLQKVLDSTAVPFKKGFLQLAFDFFELESTIRNIALRFLVLMISLEVLFNPSEMPRISHTVASNASKLLGESEQRRSEIYSELRELYKKRSSLVHQGIYDYSSYLTSVAPDFENLKINPVEARGEKASTFIQPMDLRQLRHYVRSSILKSLKIDKRKDDLLKSLAER